MFIEESNKVYDKLSDTLKELNNELVLIGFDDNIIQELKMLMPDIVIIHKNTLNSDDIQTIETIKSHPFVYETVLITDIDDVQTFKLLLNLDVKIIAKPINSLQILNALGKIGKYQKVSDAFSVETKVMGISDIVGNIAHQWRQPLNRLSGIMLNISAAKDFNKLTPEFIDTKVNQADETIKYLSQTIEDFKRFYCNNRLKENFDIESVIKEAIDLTASPVSDFVKIHFIVNSNCFLHGYRKEFFQAIINILHNAKDQLKSKNVTNPTITVTLGKNDTLCYLFIEDNAGGIEIEPIEKIFYPYKTTKKKSGTGLGLYITKTIIEEKMHGTIKASNTDVGAKFQIYLPFEEENERI
jgi:signal transduction histidine kinase